VNSGPDAVHNPPTDLLWTMTYIWNNDGDEASQCTPRCWETPCGWPI
jgi:hypothetical protein